MVHSAIMFRQAHAETGEISATQPYWSLLHGEFPYCFDDSEQTDASSDLVGCFDLILADPPRVKRLSGTRMRTSADRCQPDTGWIQYSELFLRSHGSMLIFSPLESIGSYVGAILDAGLDYRTAYIWTNQAEPAMVEAVLWATKEAPRLESPLPNNKVIDLSAADDGKQSLVEILIESFSEPDMNVLEPFTIDSSVLSACQKLRRYCLGIARKRSHIKQVKYILSGALKQTA
jgi:DNA modification methylase